jgi:hypothetical protein
MLKGILGVVGGLVASMAVIVIFQKVGQLIYPMPAGLDMQDKEAMGAWIQSLPIGAFLMLLAGYAAGSFAGGAVAVLITGKLRPALVVGGLLTLSGLANLVMIPHPLWVAVASLAIYVPLAWLGGRVFLRS